MNFTYIYKVEVQDTCTDSCIKKKKNQSIGLKTVRDSGY